MRIAPRIQYAEVRELEDIWRCGGASRGFESVELASGTRRAADFQAYMWRNRRGGSTTTRCFVRFMPSTASAPGSTGPSRCARRQPDALERARAALADEILFRQYVQWLAGDQWRAARARMGDVALFGDLPFMVSGDSADIWARQDEFRMDASVGVPPDAFSDTGQDWGLPVYRWDVLAERDFDWLRDRAHRNADLFDGYRGRSSRRLLSHLLPAARRRPRAVHARPAGCAAGARGTRARRLS